MPMDAGEIERLIRARIPDAQVTIRDLAGHPWPVSPADALQGGGTARRTALRGPTGEAPSSPGLLLASRPRDSPGVATGAFPSTTHGGALTLAGDGPSGGRRA